MKPLNQARIASLYRDGHTVRQIAAMVGGSLSAVHRRLRAAGVEARPEGRVPRRCFEAARLRETGLTLQQIADEMGVRAKSTIHRHLAVAARHAGRAA